MLIDRLMLVMGAVVSCCQVTLAVVLRLHPLYLRFSCVMIVICLITHMLLMLCQPTLPPRHYIPPGLVPVERMETSQCTIPHDNNTSIFNCDTVNLCIYPMYSDYQYCQMKQEAGRVFHNYKQDCFARHHYGISYECHLTNIIDALIVAQDSVDRQTDIDTSVQCRRVDTKNNQGHSVFDNNKLTHHNPDHQKLVQSDINYPDKVRGFIALQPTEVIVQL